MKRKFYFRVLGSLVAFVLWWGVGAAQPSHYSVSLTGGRVIPVNGSRYDGNSPTLGIDFAVAWQQAGEESWMQFWQAPFMGIRANYAHVYNDIAGDRFELAGFLEGEVYRRLHWTYSVGLSAYTRPYCLTHDTVNSFISSYLNCLIDLGFLYDVPLRNGNELFFAAKLVHTSNGYLYKPNHGLNYLQAELGYRFASRPSAGYFPRSNSLAARWNATRDTSSLHTRIFFSFAPGAVMSREDPIDEIRYYFAYTAQVGVIRQVHPCFAFGGNLDLMYNFAHKAYAPADEWPVYPALHVFGDCNWGPVTLRLGLAHYLAYYPQNWEQYYERVGLYYRFGRDYRQRLGVAMKVHYDHIDYIEWTYSFEL